MKHFYRGMCAVWCALVLTGSGAAVAQESVGFADAADIDGLLAYRLPDWGYRTWDMRFGLDGSGADGRFDGVNSVTNRTDLALATFATFHGESERRVRRYGLGASGDYHRAHAGNDERESRTRLLNSRADLNGTWHEYLGSGPFLVGAGGHVRWNYEESVRGSRYLDDAQTDSRYTRSTSLRLNPVLGVGRVRDVMPLIRAQRLSERLVALGRAPLSEAQVQEVARVLAREHGYRAVFERPDRSFWRDVLAPMLDPERPLSPYEIFYLRDVLQEDLGLRSQGAQVTAGFTYDENRRHATEVQSYRSRGLSLQLLMSRNLTLDHQVSVLLRGGYEMATSGESGRDRGSGYLRLQHDWVVADRLTLQTASTTIYDYSELDENGVNREISTRLGSDLRIRVEDQMAIVAGISGNYRHRQMGEDPDRDSLGWSYGLGFEYALDRLLY